MSYTRTNWKDYPEKATPVNAENLNNMEDGIEEAILAAENLRNEMLKCIKQENVVGTGSKETVASSAWVQSLESMITTLQRTHKGDVENLQDGINANKKSINSNSDEIKQVRALAEAIQMETFKKTDLTAEVSDSLEFGGKTIGKNNAGMYMIIMFRQSSTYGKDTCSIWSALISSTPENSSAIRILGGGSTSEPSLKVTTGGNLRILGTGTAGATYRGLIFKL